MNNLRRELEGLRRLAEERRSEGKTYLDYPEGIERKAFQIWKVICMHRRDAAYGGDPDAPIPTYESTLELLRGFAKEREGT